MYLHGGRTPTGIDAVEWAIDAVARGAGEILLTSMDRDGTREGFDLELTRAIADAVTVPVIASGGVGTLDHLVDGIVVGGADAVLAASIFHFQEHTIAEAKALMAAVGRGRPTRRRIASARMSSAAVTTEQRDGVLICHIDDGKANALSAEIIAAISAVVDRRRTRRVGERAGAARPSREVQRRVSTCR